MTAEQEPWVPTHEGWCGICPVLASEVDTEAPMVAPRYPWLSWLLTLSDAMQGVAFTLLSATNPSFVPMWPLRLREIRK